MCRRVVLGGGPAGMLAALRMAETAGPVDLVEANSRLGVKLRITGGGNCNLAQDCSVQELLRAFPKDQARFLKPAFYAFPPQAVQDFFRQRGLALHTREDGRIFPVQAPGGAALVMGVLQEALEAAGVRLHLGQRVLGLEATAPRVEALRLEGGGRLEGDHFVLATGGASYPTTGSWGEVPGWLSKLGIRSRSWSAALAPIVLNEARPTWQGIALRGGRLWLQEASGKRRACEAGDLLFTRVGVTGPAVLGLSRQVDQALRSGPMHLSYQCVAGTPEELDAQLVEAQRQDASRSLRNWLKAWLPERIIEGLMLEAGIPLEQRLRDLPKASRRKAVDWLWGLSLGSVARVDLVKGEVCAGGISLEAVDPVSMQVRGWENLRLCGELLDLDGPIGGYNLQVAFSTGWAAGQPAK